MADLPEDSRNSSHSSNDHGNGKGMEDSVHSAANGTSSSASGTAEDKRNFAVRGIDYGE
ncbi:hypothetical protein LR48_Vigan11g132600 [Vigna angularis]|uniref:Uncharacterized protein n=1 Tax=Phaseolus angularis TaxID=3914 RepID=A0A0L9VTV3_PHAAN|nr:hypothetical protein LR48_Vigan11g132600 [Vigna angularis]